MYIFNTQLGIFVHTVVLQKIANNAMSICQSMQMQKNYAYRYCLWYKPRVVQDKQNPRHTSSSLESASSAGLASYTISSPRGIWIHRVDKRPKARVFRATQHNNELLLSWFRFNLELTGPEQSNNSWFSKRCDSSLGFKHDKKRELTWFGQFWL